VIEAKIDSTHKKVSYKINTSVILEMGLKNDVMGEANLGGSLAKAVIIIIISFLFSPEIFNLFLFRKKNRSIILTINN